MLIEMMGPDGVYIDIFQRNECLDNLAKRSISERVFTVTPTRCNCYT